MVEAVMLWNEPNNLSHWDFKVDPDWKMFADMAIAGARAIRQVNPEMKIVMGGISPIDPHFIELLTEHSPPRFDYNVRGSVYVSFDGLFGVGPRRESGVVNLHGFCAPKRFYSYRNTPAISHRSDLRAFLQYCAEPSRFLGGSAATIKLTRYRRISSGCFQMCGMDVVGHAADREAGAPKAG